MSSLMESRWAATPEPSNVNPLEETLLAKQIEVVEPKSLMSSRWADTPEPDDEPEVGKQEETEKKFKENANNTVEGAERIAEEEARVEDNTQETQREREDKSVPENGIKNEADVKHSMDQTAAVNGAAQVNVQVVGESIPTQVAEANVDQAVSNARLEPPRLKKRVSWRGRNIVIAIPRLDYEAAGTAKPMSTADVDARMKQFEDDGFDISGYDLADDQSMDEGRAQVRAIFPAESESKRLPSRGEIKVILPDLEKWRRYMDWLTEQKLAALGVTLGFDEPAQPSTQDLSMSRQSSGQYPPLPFSPPLPTGSGGSMGRPMGRGHSHTMSVASPVSSMGGAFGHMHRHSTFTGAPMNFEQLGQQPILSPGIPGMANFSPQQQLGFSGVPRGGSPAQLSALRQDLGVMRGPGSPLSQQILQQTPQDYSRGLAEDQRRRQHAYSQSMHQPSLPPSFMQGSHMRLTPAALPELPEDDDEEDLREADDDEPQAYVPPQKRVQADTEIAVPTPRGHRHNISEGLEREVVEAEQRQKAAIRSYPEVTEEEEHPSVIVPTLNGVGKQTSLPPLPKPTETDPLGSNYPVKETTHGRKKSTSRFNVAAPAFTFNPGATFKPGQSEFTFGAPAINIPAPAPTASSHNRHRSSGSFNVNAPSFKPTTSEFSFSASGPAFKANLPVSQVSGSELEKNTIVDELPGIFGKIEIPDIVKPARRSKAIPILRPEERNHKSVSGSATEYEDDEGRVAQGEAKRKQQRKPVDDGDDVPLFAEPTPVPVHIMPPPAEKVLGSNDAVSLPALRETKEEDDIEETDEDVSKNSPSAVHSIDGAESAQARVGTEPAKQTHGHKHSTSLSALAKPFQPPTVHSAATESVADEAGFSSISDLEEGEIREDTPHQGPFKLIPNDRNVPAPHVEPSFDEIDAVMQQLNAQESEDKEQQSPLRMPSPGSHPMKGVTYLAEWSRSDAPSPSPRRRLIETNGDLDSWQVRQLNKAEEVPTSDWSGMLSPPDEEKLHQRSHFFDDHIANLIGRALEQHLQPLEDSLQSIHTTVSKRERPNDVQLKRRSSNAESDADDEDDLFDELKQRPISRGRDKRVDQIKIALMEALREQSPSRSQTAVAIAELHSALADMKVSFARAASANLELDDIRAIVEDTMTRQSQAQSQALVATRDEGEMTHKRELSELQGRLNETLAGALEEANQRRAIEERESETRRQLRLAQEELQLLRDSARDDDSKSRAMEDERTDMLVRLDESEERRRDAEDKLEDSEAQNGALQATLEEYRMSSKKWREDIEEGKREREELENTLSLVRRQAEDNQDPSSSMRRRLEKLHADMATACGQLASEKAMWKSKEEDYRARVESLESQRLVADRERSQVEDELRAVRITALEASKAHHTLEHVRSSNNSLEEMMHKLQGELSEQQALAARYERQFHEAQESARAEVHRTRRSLENEVEAANHQVNLVRAELEAEVTKVRAELENAKMESDTAKARHEHLLDQEETVRREALRKVNHSSSVALDEARHKFESSLQDITAQHTRALEHAIEDKTRAEAFLSERLALSDAKLQHYQERVVYLEERLEVTKSAAQAAAQNAKGSKSFSSVSPSTSVPEKVSPQALRESILVLQEQLQERERRIERLQIQVEEEDVAKLRERDTEIGWLRELLAVRNEELTDLVNTISRPNFDRAMVRDTAIRIRANLQMEQQEKERFGRSPQTVGSALASLTSLATPKAAQFSSAFNKWRSTMESSALKTQQRAGPPRRSLTPSKAPAAAPPAGYHAGLMTPPASNLRSSPMPEDLNTLLPPRLQPRAGSNASAHSSSKSTVEAPQAVSRKPSTAASDGPTTPLFREHSYDEDAEDSAITMQNIEDDDLEGVEDSDGPPAFRSLESELGEAAESIETTD